MHGMIGMTELLLHTDLSEQQKQFASAAHNSGESLLSLINAILDFSKIEASKVEIELIEFNIVELIDEICYLQGEPAQKRDLALNNIFSVSVPDQLLGDPTKIRQVVMNLLSNSLKFTHEGNVNVRVTSDADPQRTNYVVVHISVEDDGIGMDEETQHKVFEAFTQADTSTTREYGGTGLGLAISRQYIDMMGGTISIESEVGRGTKITVNIPLQLVQNIDRVTPPFEDTTAIIFSENAATIEMVSSHLIRLGIEATDSNNLDQLAKHSSKSPLCFVDFDLIKMPDQKAGLPAVSQEFKGIILTPLIDIELPAPFTNWLRLSKPVTAKGLLSALGKLTGNGNSTVQDAKEIITPKTSSALRVLVAEDVETNQKIALEMIQMLGCEVDIADNGEEAIEKFENGNYDLIFMDCQMPIMDGYEATRRIRELEREGKLSPVPIVALTAGINKEDKLRCKDAGMNRYLTKPFSIPDITAVLREFLGHNIGSKPINGLDKEKRTEADTTTTHHVVVINKQAVDNIREVEKQTGRLILPAIFEGFNSQMADKLQEIDDNFQSGDSDAIYRTAHAIKSMSANIGAEQVRQISSNIEIEGRAGSLENAGDNIILLKGAYREFAELFKTEIAV